MKKNVFYSWQSDLPNGTNRTFIENALKEAAKAIENDDSADIEPVIDRDTQGVAGAPNIATAIFQKIDAADIFVADVSIIGNVGRRFVPNPNVLIELGYALKSLGHERIILIFNTAFGDVEKLPFDLRMHRTLTYECPESATDRSNIKASLVRDLKSALLPGLMLASSKKTQISIIDTIKNNAPSKKIELRVYLAELLKEIEKLQPPMKRDGGTTEEFLAAIPKTENISIEFAKLAETIVLMDDMSSAKEVFQWFGKLLTKYDPVLSNGGTNWNCDGDYYKFIGHELFVNFIAPFLRENKWSELKEILKGTLHVGRTLNSYNERNASWTELSEHCPWLADEGQKKQRVSLHADLLHNRHGAGELASIVPFKDFADTDFFLYLYGDGQTKNGFAGDWYPRSYVWITDVPRFITESVDFQIAMKICAALKISDVEELKRRLNNMTIRWDGRPPVNSSDINAIGSEGGAQIIE